MLSLRRILDRVLRAVQNVSTSSVGAFGQWGRPGRAPGSPTPVGNIAAYREMYWNEGYVRGAINHIAHQSVQTGPMIVAGRTDAGRRFMDGFRPLASVPHETMVEWLVDLATHYLIDGELYLRRVQDAGLHFETLDPSRIDAVVRDEMITGWKQSGRSGGEWRIDDPNYLHVFDIRYPGQTRGVSLLRAAQTAVQELSQARRAMDSAMAEYEQLRGYWEVSSDDKQELERPFTGETDQEREDRIKRNDELMNRKFVVPYGGSPLVSVGTQYHVIQRGGDAFIAVYQNYVRVKNGEISRALGVAEYVVSGSVAETNYSALRIARAESEHRYRATQQALEDIIRWVWRHYVVWQGGNMPPEIDEIRWPPQRPLDLRNDVYALSTAVRDKFMSRETAAVLMGHDWETEYGRIVAEQAMFERDGVTLPSQPYPADPDPTDAPSKRRPPPSYWGADPDPTDAPGRDA